MERARQRYGSADYRAAQGVMRDVLVRLVNERYDDALAAVRCPVELVWGDDDADVPVERARALAAALPQARLTVCPGAGHLLPLTAPGRVAGRRRPSLGPAACDPPRRCRGRAAGVDRGGRATVAAGGAARALSRRRHARASPCGGGHRVPVNLVGLVAAVAGLVLSSRWPAAAFATAVVVARRARRLVVAGPDVATGVDAAAAHLGFGVGGPRGRRRGGWDRRRGRARWRPPRRRWRCRPWSTWPVR